MSSQYSPRAFFRKAPNKLLKAYFKAKKLTDKFNFKDLKETNIEPIYEAWLELDDAEKKEMETDFRQIHYLANEAGSLAIRDEAKYHEENLAPKLHEMESFHEKSFWTFLNRKDYWEGALHFFRADKIGKPSWKKYKDIPKEAISADDANIESFEKAIADFFHQTQARGKNCKVERYKRNNREYFFAYPEDYATTTIEWDGQELDSKTYRPAFEVIFVFSSKDGTLDIACRGNKGVVDEMHQIFTQKILNKYVELNEQDREVYNLEQLKDRNFQFTYSLDSGVEEMIVTKLRLTDKLTEDKILLDPRSKNTSEAVYKLLDRYNINLSKFDVSQAFIKARFRPEKSFPYGKKEEFRITCPDYCSLKTDGKDLILRDILADSGIDKTESMKN